MTHNANQLYKKGYAVLPVDLNCIASLNQNNQKMEQTNHKSLYLSNQLEALH